jgi:hypothetical protein
MLRTLDELHDYTIDAADGTIGHLKDLYLDDEAWVVRYLVVETGSWLASKKVLISPIAIGVPDWTQRLLPVSITKDQVRNSPDVDTQKPVTRQHERVYASYYGYPDYWGGMGYWGGGMDPGMMLSSYGGTDAAQAIQQQTEAASARADIRADEAADPHLRSCAAITGYHLHASDGEIGHVSGMLIDEETWAVRYLIVDTSNWWLGHQLLVASSWIEGVSWDDETVSVNLRRQEIKEAPAYDPTERLSRAGETLLHDHYIRSGYWVDGERRETDISRIKPSPAPRN